MNTLVFLEHRGDTVTRASLGVLAKARSLGDAAGVIAGAGVKELAGQAGGTVYLADDARLDAPLPQPRVDVLAKLVRDDGFDAVLFAQSVLAADVAAGLAVRIGAGLNWDLVDMELRTARRSGRDRRSRIRSTSRPAGRRRRRSPSFAPAPSIPARRRATRTSVTSPCSSKRIRRRSSSSSRPKRRRRARRSRTPT